MIIDIYLMLLQAYLEKKIFSFSLPLQIDFFTLAYVECTSSGILTNS